ncbi:ABC transporter ATP-binding protein [Burkholderia stagnalis]|uniref:ABC transporter ATP-binding protein n=1 Tax=Burkholderia stagnalis TaxID=1503054 RepID=UPI0007545155|nr:ABC transporter ATP-binding protein [Burkholderia stagnalis]KVM78185.1 sulfonate ABC transporter ATP-binding protein [Burkholderia stagnalis]KWI40185.1 sulfonate ABC transporter ATP-binding protein [Burkholderia stagnalis]KWI76803.1 sulfonate ABC transporter ATP-binding protein [Burkholderia stagnalis]
MNHAPHPAPLLDVRVEHKQYAARTVLARVALQIGRGEIVSLVGPSGCGKSTLLRIVAGLDRAYRGEVRLDGVAQHEPSPHIGVIFQEPRLLPWLSVADNVGFAAGRHGGRDPRVAPLLDEVGLAAFAHALPSALSGGMAQRAALARGLFSQPALLLLDEPFSAVDAMTRMRLQALLLALVATHGTSALVVTHDLDEALYLSDRVLLLAADPGRIDREIRVDRPRPRERHDPLLAQLRAELLASLDRQALAAG